MSTNVAQLTKREVMSFIDISQGWYEGMPSYDAPWYPQFSINPVMTPESDPAGVGRTFTELRIFPHNGTHIETGFHFFADREKIDEVPLETFVGPAMVADLSHKRDLEPITGEDLDNIIGEAWRPGLRLLIRTDHPLLHLGKSDYWDTPPYLTPSAADWMVDNHVSLVGLDCLTEQPGDRTSPVHRRLLEAGIPILENIQNLHLVSRADVHLVALPIKVSGVEAAPTRALVFENWGR
ncbi:cyclase family protein [Streptomyces bikiniensis]|uniref:Cyclase family protein n=1 Tax=Streptomyces bikiniensis TaxID=1896 RepID=A0ABW8D1B4_STRBI